MTCPGCQKEIASDRLFCAWCERFVPSPLAGVKAGVGRRLAALIMDVVLFWFLFLVITALLYALFGIGRRGEGSEVFGGFVLAWIGYTIAMLWFLSRGFTLGKYVMNEQVVDHLSGGNPGLGKMLLREIFGKFISGLFFGLGYLWAIWDKDGQAWHDKIAGTVVVTGLQGRARTEPAIPVPVVAGSVPASTSRFCTACGSRMTSGHRFCTACGASEG